MGNRIPDEALIDELQAGALAIGRAPTISEMKELGDYSPKVYIRRFGSWLGALEEAGLEVPERRRKISKGAAAVEADDAR